MAWLLGALMLRCLCERNSIILPVVFTWNTLQWSLLSLVNLNFLTTHFRGKHLQFQMDYTTFWRIQSLPFCHLMWYLHCRAYRLVPPHNKCLLHKLDYRASCMWSEVASSNSPLYLLCKWLLIVKPWSYLISILLYLRFLWQSSVIVFRCSSSLWNFLLSDLPGHICSMGTSLQGFVMLSLPSACHHPLLLVLPLSAPGYFAVTMAPLASAKVTSDLSWVFWQGLACFMFQFTSMFAMESIFLEYL